MADSALRPPFTLALRRGHLIALDAVAGVALTLLCAYAAAEPATDGYREPVWAGWLLAAAIGLPVTARRLWPVRALAVVLSASVAAVLLEVIPLFAIVAPFITVAFALYLVALTVPVRPALVALAACLIGAAGGSLAVADAGSPGYREDLLGGIVFLGLLMAAPWLLGWTLRERRAYAVLSARRLADQAVTDERLRIARELHDIVAHSMSLIAVKAGIANHVAHARPDEAHDALRVIEATSRSALTEMRHLLGVLRPGSGGEPAGLGPAPGLAGLRELAERAAPAGVHVDLDLRVSAEPPEGVELSVYRIVQESLTNVVKHAAPAHCRVTVEAGEREVRVEITDDGPGNRASAAAAPGHGLIGMRERVMMYDGTFTAGPRPERGFAVSARIPYAPIPGTSAP